MTDDIKLTEPTVYQISELSSGAFGIVISKWRDVPSRDAYLAYRIPKRELFTADQLRAAVLADLAERASAADLELPNGAIHNGRACIDRLDGYYDFECEGGPLRMNVEWDILKRSFEHLCRHIERANGIVEKE